MTFYRFISEIKWFLSRLLKNPISAQPSEELKEYGFDRKKIINILIKRGVLIRDEKILVPNEENGIENVKYQAKYTIKRKNFERAIRRIYIQYFEKNIPETNEIITEEGGTGPCSVAGCETAGTAAACNDCAPIGKFGTVITRPILINRKKDKKHDPTTINGKTISEGKDMKTPRNIYLTEKQLNHILKETSLGSVGSIAYDSPLFMNLKTSDGKKDPSLDREKGLSCHRIK